MYLEDVPNILSSSGQRYPGHIWGQLSLTTSLLQSASSAKKMESELGTGVGGGGGGDPWDQLQSPGPLPQLLS